MESTGVYWKPVWNILEGYSFQLIIANAQLIRNTSGRKTDVKDAEWIAQLLRSGLIEGSFVPHTEIRDLRDLTLYH
jgi:transposase